MNFRPKDQIVLLAGLEADDVRERIWAFPELRPSVERLVDAGLLRRDADSSSGRGSPTAVICLEPAGESAARALRHITLADLVAEHLPERS